MLEPRNESETHHNDIFDPFQSIHDVKGYLSSVNSGAGARITADIHQKSSWNINGDYGVQFRPLQNSVEDDETGEIHSPPLWQSSPPHRSSQYQNYNIYRSLSPTSRTQAIVRGQRELMEMVKNMPESSYELSLKDLVEHHHRPIPRIMGSPKEETCLLDQNRNYDDEDHEEQVLKQRKKPVRRQESNNEKKKAQTLRSGSMMENRGLFLKMVFPVSFKSRKKRNLVTQNSNISSRVSPKPEISSSVKTSNSKSISVEKEWWTKRFAGSNGSDEQSGITDSSKSGSTGSSGSSSSIHSHSSNGRRKKMGFIRSCFSCFYSTRSQGE